MQCILGRATSAPRRTGGGRRRSFALASLALSASLVATSMAGAQTAGAVGLLTGSERVIVTAGSPPDAAALVVGNLGSVLATLPVVNGVEATVSPAAATALASLPGVNVTPDITVDVQSTNAPSRPGAAVFPESTGASTLAAEGDTGSGVNVAILDTGIDNLPDFAGRLVGGST